MVCTPISVRRPAYPEHEVGSRTHRREARQPDVLEDAEDAELALLVDEGVVGDECEVEMQCQATRMEVITSFCLMLLTTSIPWRTWPNTVCTLSRWRLRAVADEELAAAGVLAGVRHGQCAGDMLVRVQMGLALDLVARTAGAHARDCLALWKGDRRPGS